MFITLYERESLLLSKTSKIKAINHLLNYIEHHPLGKNDSLTFFYDKFEIDSLGRD